ncbi:MAG: CehA/McbA family metallohydrolase [Proteobacteria bacterium]|nr:CehA/McbA family metallohydrolase [Pseudomonadota bacterium]
MNPENTTNTLFVPRRTWRLPHAGYGTHPEIAVDAQGRLWVGWIEWDGEAEAVMLCHAQPDGEFCAPFAICARAEAILSLALMPWQDGVAAAWIALGDPERDGLMLRQVSSAQRMGPAHLVQPARRYPMGLTMASGDGRFILAWTVREPRGRQVEGIVGSDIDALPRPALFSERRIFNLRPAVAVSEGVPWVAWQSMSPSGSRILARHFDAAGQPGDILAVTRAQGGIDAMCSLAPCREGGVWVAWHTDKGAGASPTLVRWIDLVRLEKDGICHRPKADMPGIDRDARGEDQGFEFPAIATAPSGRLVIIGRGSQSLRRQDLTADGWTPRGQVDAPGWQCRSRYKVALHGDAVWVVGRERKGIVLRELPLTESVETTATPSIGFAWRQEVGTTILGRRLLFGDIHQHTVNSDGTGTDAEVYLRARYRYGDELVAVADHESFLGKQTTPGEWARIMATADDFYEPGAFVTLYAYEWTGIMHPGPGHKVIYPAPTQPLLFSRDDPRYAASHDLLAACREHGALAFPHHVGWSGADMDSHDPEVQTCFEIVSCHGAYEREGGTPIGTRGNDKPGQFVADALDAGLRFGFVGGSDGHGLNWHHGVCRIQDSHRTGLTAVIADSVTREGVLDALARRCCYATSGARIALWFEVDGMPMGETVRPGGVSAYRVVVRGTADIASLCLVTNGGRETPLRFEGDSADVHGTLPPPPVQRAIYYFVRVVQTDGHMAWSSPIWLESSPDPLNDRLTA